MGTNYSQKAVLGFEVNFSELLIELSPEVTEKQPRYNTKTGEIERYETVVVKQAEEVYQFEDIKEEDIYDFIDLFNKKYKDSEIEMFHDNYESDYVYIGVSVGNSENYGRFEPLEGEVELDWLHNKAEQIRQIFPGRHISLNFFSRIG